MTKQRSYVIIATIMLIVSACQPSGETRPAPTNTASAPIHPTLTPISTQPPTEPVPTATPTRTVQPGCTNTAVLLADVTIPDNTPLKKGEAFIKTWRIRNTGTCTWGADYLLVFSKGNQMKGPASTPLPVVAPGMTTDISLSLVAPAQDGVFTGFYEFHDPKGQAFDVGLVKNIWVQIIAGSPIIIPTSQPTFVPGVTRTPGPCTYTENSGYINQLINLINSERQANGLPAYQLNAKLSAAAMGHSIDMACNNFSSHTGSNGSWISDRIAAQGYSASFSVEVIFPSGTPQEAMNWWMNDPPHAEAILSRQATEFGIGYAYSSGSTYGGYYTVDFASP